MKTGRLVDGQTLTVHRNDGLRKRCDCPRRQWPKCPHDWHFNFKYGDQPPYRFSLDRYLGRRLNTREEARIAAEQIRVAIRAGTFTLKPAPAVAPATPDANTFAAYGDIFVKLCPIRKGKNKGQPRGANDRSMLAQLAAMPGADGQPLGPRPVGSITIADLESAFGKLRGKGRAANTRNKYLTLVRLLSKWGKRKGYLSQPWFVDGNDEDSPDLQRETGTQRDRRIEPDEERRIRERATPFLQRLIIAVLETACREGELLGLRWQDLSIARREFTVRPDDVKTGKPRTLPISADFLALLKLVQHDPAGNPLPQSAHVFGDAVGGRMVFPQKAWENAVLRAHGYVPHWTPTKELTRECRAALRTIDVTFHDLRHEAGSRILERGWPLHHIQLMLGHANLAQTSTYLNATKRGLHESMKRFGTTSLHSVAPKAPGDHPPSVQLQGQNTEQVTVN